jgi:RNA polymerase sigma-70 factor, ECF subfamily
MTLENPAAAPAAPRGYTELLSPDEQSDLVDRIRRGDKTAEERFVCQYQRAVLVLLRARTGDAESSRDLAQEALLAALVAVRQGRVREPEKLGAFVCSTARNLALKYQRSKKRRPISMDTIPEPSVPPLQAAVEENERAHLVDQALMHLDDAERAVLQLTWLEGRTPRDIAEHLSVTSEVVRARKSRALKKVTDYVRRHINRRGSAPPG